MTDNDNLELKKRSRRRLVGAGALALLAAIVLPLVMEQEPEPAPHDIQVTIPEREANATLTRPIEDRSAPAAELSAVSPPDLPPAAPETATPPAAIAGAVAEPIEGQSPPFTASQPAGAAPVPPAVERPPVAKAPKADDGARAMALLEGRTPPATIGNEAFVVQIAAFSAASKANALDAELKKRGFASYTEKAGTVTRVRVGPFSNRAEAQKAAERLHAGGMKGVVIAR